MRSDGAKTYGSRNTLRWTVLVLLLALAGVGVWIWSSREAPLRYITAVVTEGDIERTVSMTGTLNPVVTAQVESYVSGNIKSWSCDYNTAVKAGQICAIIDPQPFEVIVDQDTASLHSAVAQLEKDRVAAANQANVYAYDQMLIGEGIVSQETLNTDKATLDQDRAQVRLDTATVAQQQAALHGALVNLGYTKIVSPVNGMVITRYIDIGQTVVSSMSASPLFLIGKDMHVMQVDTNVSEADVGGVKPGQRASFTVQAYPNRTFSGTVRQIREGPITVQNVVTYDVVVDVKNDDLALYPGMTADAHIITAERNHVLRVPLPAIRFNPAGLARAPRASATNRPAQPPSEGGEQGGSPAEGRGLQGSLQTTTGPEHRTFAGSPGGAPGAHGRAARGRLWLLRAGRLVPVAVRTGLDDGTLIEVTTGELKAGDTVVVNAVRPGSESPQEPSRDRAGGPGGNASLRGGFRL